MGLSPTAAAVTGRPDRSDPRCTSRLRTVSLTTGVTREARTARHPQRPARDCHAQRGGPAEHAGDAALVGDTRLHRHYLRGRVVRAGPRPAHPGLAAEAQMTAKGTRTVPENETPRQAKVRKAVRTQHEIERDHHGPHAETMLRNLAIQLHERGIIHGWDGQHLDAMLAFEAARGAALGLELVLKMRKRRASAAPTMAAYGVLLEDQARLAYRALQGEPMKVGRT